eukprot:COSAG02_NODE_58477_length_277_cov_0.584270_1_plen_47_part_01
MLCLALALASLTYVDILLTRARRARTAARAIALLFIVGYRGTAVRNM